VKPRLRARLYINLQRWLKRINPTRLGISLVLLASLTLIAREYFSLRATLLADIAVQTSLIAENSTAALAFRDRDATSEILSALRVSSSIESAIIVDRQYTIQASHPRLQEPPSEATANPAGPAATFDPKGFFPEGIASDHEQRFSLTHLYLMRPIANKSRPLGFIFIKARLQPMYEQLAAFIGAAVLALPVFGALGASLLVVGRLRGQVSQARRELYRLAYVDTVTQLPNRNVFNQRLEGMLARMRRRQGRLALLFLDLDNFKFINDTFGHPVGDQLLLGVTRRLSGALRESDLLCRLGGDEFALILEDIDDQSAAAGTARRLLDTLEPPFLIEGREIYVSTSIGISLYPDDGADPEFLLKSADTAMYHAKEQGRNNFQFFSKELNSRTARRLELETGFRRALERGEFHLVYQPIFDLESQRTTGVETLLRWQSPNGPIAPDEFIPVAEESGMILPIAHWALRRACEQLRAWREAGLSDLEIAVNLSTRQFRDPHLVPQIAEIIAATGTPPQSLWLEITETTLMTDTAAALRKLHELRALGIRLAIDDFGTGYSSLSYLKKLPIAKLKIDRSFIADLPDDGDASAITEAILALARSLRLMTVAEGVETAEQMEFLTQRGCQAAQGYHIGMPVSADAIAALVLGELARTRKREAVRAMA
jgi:diguanylate cyclase (GGDEF)-like protein